MDIADTIDWRRVKSFSMLCTVSEIYKVTKHYSEARDILLLAYERYPDRANVVYALCELAVKLDEVSDAIEYYREYVHLKPHDTNRYVLLYKIYDAQDVPLEEKISLLEEFKRAEYTEKWAYELALLYHKDGQETKCVETCDELALWFGEGPYVRKALELKMQHSPLTKEQQQKYDGVYDAPAIPTGETEETVHIYETQSMPRGISYETSPIDNTDSLLKPSIAKDFGEPMPAETSAVSKQQTSDIQVAPYTNDKYSTMNLQEELAKNMEEFYAKEKNVMPTPYYGVTSQLYDPSQEQFMQQLNSAGPVQEPAFAPQQMYQMDAYQPNAYQQNAYPGMQQAYQPNAYDGMQQAYQPNAYQQNAYPGYGQPGMYQQPSAYDPNVSQAPAYAEPQKPVFAEPITAQPSNEPQIPQSIQPAPQIAPMNIQEVPVQPAPVNVQPAPAQPAPMNIQAAQPVPQAISQNIQAAPAPQSVAAPQNIQAAPAPQNIQPEQAAPMPQITPEQPAPAQPVQAVAQSVPLTSVQVPGTSPAAAPEEPETPIDEQVPGQIDLSDFMKDWEKKKKSGEEQRKQQILNRTKEQTQDIMSQLVGVIPGIDSQSSNGPATPSPETTPEAENGPATPSLGSRVKEEVIKEDKKGVVTRTTIPSPVFDRETVKRTESGARINGPARTSITESIPDILPNADLPLKGDVLPSGRKLTLEEEYGGNIAKIRKEDEELVKRMTGEIPETEEKEAEPEPPAPEPVDYGETEEIEEVEQPDLPEEEEEQRASEPVMPVMPAMPVMPSETEPEPEADEPEEPEPEEAVEEPENDEAEAAQDDKDAVRHGLTAPIEYPYDVDDLGEVEELETIDQPYDVDDMIKTRPIPQEEIEARMRYEAGIEEDYSADEESDAKKANHPSWMKLEENVTSRREFDESEMAIFGRFEGIESLKAQIVDVMDDMRMEASRGNVIVMGSEKYGRKSLAIDIVKAIQAMDSTFSGKVAKISGEALNKKNISMTLQKLRNGALIVENAGGLTPITVNSITETLRNDVDSILVVFEGEKDSLEPLLNGCVETKTVFDARITIEDFSNSDLVAYAKGYARELEYSIDDMGTLALYNKIGDMQTIDHVVSVDEVIDIVDNAIRHVDRKNMSHFMDVLLAKRYDDDDFIVLREKDFLG